MSPLPYLSLPSSDGRFEVRLTRGTDGAMGISVFAKRLNGNHVCFCGKLLSPDETTLVGYEVLRKVGAQAPVKIKVMVNVFFNGSGIAVVPDPDAFER